MAEEKSPHELRKYFEQFINKIEGKEPLREDFKFAEEQRVDFELQLKIKREKALIKTIKDNNAARRTFGVLIYILTVLWLFFILLIIVQCARGVFFLSDQVLIVLITTSTVNVLGFFTAVTLYLFNKEKST